MPTAAPGAAHHALINDLHGVLGRYAGMPPVEQIAVMAQAIGQIIAALDTNVGSSGEIMHAVAANIAAGNAAASTSDVARLGARPS